MKEIKDKDFKIFFHSPTDMDIIKEEDITEFTTDKPQLKPEKAAFYGVRIKKY